MGNQLATGFISFVDVFINKLIGSSIIDNVSLANKTMESVDTFLKKANKGISSFKTFTETLKGIENIETYSTDEGPTGLFLKAILYVTTSSFISNIDTTESISQFNAISSILSIINNIAKKFTNLLTAINYKLPVNTLISSFTQNVGGLITGLDKYKNIERPFNLLNYLIDSIALANIMDDFAHIINKANVKSAIIEYLSNINLLCNDRIAPHVQYSSKAIALFSSKLIVFGNTMKRTNAIVIKFTHSTIKSTNALKNLDKYLFETEKRRNETLNKLAKSIKDVANSVKELQDNINNLDENKIISNFRAVAELLETSSDNIHMGPIVNDVFNDVKDGAKKAVNTVKDGAKSAINLFDKRNIQQQQHEQQPRHQMVTFQFDNIQFTGFMKTGRA